MKFQFLIYSKYQSFVSKHEDTNGIRAYTTSVEGAEKFNDFCRALNVMHEMIANGAIRYDEQHEILAKPILRG